MDREGAQCTHVPATDLMPDLCGLRPEVPGAKIATHATVQVFSLMMLNNIKIEPCFYSYFVGN